MEKIEVGKYTIYCDKQFIDEINEGLNQALDKYLVKLIGEH